MALNVRNYIAYEESVFREISCLRDLTDVDLILDYRLNCHFIENLAEEFARSEFSEHSDRSRALTPKTQICHLHYNIIILSIAYTLHVRRKRFNSRDVSYTAND